MHDTYPQDDEPCWACIRRFTNETLNPSDSIAVGNQENTKLCRVDGKTPCVQYPSGINECNCDPCEGCEVQLTYTGNLKGVLRRLVACWNEDEIYPDSKSFQVLAEAKQLL